MNEENINKLNMLEQNLRQFMQQKQALQAQVLEFESALSELTDDDSYKLVGNILVKKDPKKLREEIEDEMKKTSETLKNLEVQESKVRDKAESLRKELMEDMKK
jgi:prefoldin beta subunit